MSCNYVLTSIHHSQVHRFNVTKTRKAIFDSIKYVKKAWLKCFTVSSPIGARKHKGIFYFLYSSKEHVLPVCFVSRKYFLSPLKACNAMNWPRGAVISFYILISTLIYTAYPWSVHYEYTLMQKEQGFLPTMDLGFPREER